jgi:putative ABC transport system permease protein
MERFIYLLNIALEAVFVNRTRSVLTALGIVFGVAAVITMLAIGNGAKKEVLDQMKMVGVNNIVITPVPEEQNDAGGEEDNGGAGSRKEYSTGLTLKDAEAIEAVLPGIAAVSPEVSYRTPVIRGDKQAPATITGVSRNFFRLFDHRTESGSLFTDEQMTTGAPVCIISPAMKARFFQKQNPVGKYIKCGNVWLKVTGVLQSKNISSQASEDFNISNINETIYAPVNTVLIRFKDRSVVTRGQLEGNNNRRGGSGGFIANDDKQYGNNQLNKIVVQVNESSQLKVTSKVIHKMLKRRHNDQEDFEVVVPELLLQQEQRTKNIFNIVLGAIASISLLVGGIGIMNIMLASVMERIKEIGIRLAIGARKRDVVLQFLSEATIISVIGGVIGIGLGVAMARLVMNLAGILTIVAWDGVIISFVVSAAVGIVFGWMPARKAASQDPVESLRYE